MLGCLVAKSRNDILWRFIGDSKSLDRASKKAQGSLKDTEKSSSRTERAIGGVRRSVGLLAGAFAAREVGQFALDAATMASNAEIAGESLEKVLGPAADDLRGRFDELRYQMGLNALEFDTLSTALSMLLTSEGVAADEAATLVGDLINMGGDLAAFMPAVGDAEGAINDMTAAIRGEFDPLEKWGVKLSEAKVQAEIARLEGIDPLFAALSDPEKRIQAVISLIENGAAPAIGALGENAETAAAQTNTLNTKLDDLKIELGQYLQPVLEDSMEALIDIAGHMTDVADETATWTERLGSLGEVWDTLVGDVGVQIQEIRDEFDLWIGRFKAVDEWFDRLRGKAGDFITNPFRNWKLPSLSLPSWIPGVSGRAAGGPVSAGTPYMVGERGPELMVPGRSGTVIPNNQLGGGGPVINVNFNGVVGDPVEVAAQIQDLIELYGRSNGLP